MNTLNENKVRIAIRIALTPKRVFLYILFLLCMYLSTTVNGQTQQIDDSPKPYKGFQVAYGRHSFQSTSNYQQINRDVVSLDGGQVGIAFGNDMVRYSATLLGYYSSVSDIAGTIHFYTNNAMVRFYPMSAISQTKTRMAPYMIAGISYDRYKVHGYYAKADNSRVNTKIGADGPEVGKIRETTAQIGLGFEYKIIDTWDFIHLFTEAKAIGGITRTTSAAELLQTKLSNRSSVIIGVRFGIHRSNFKAL